MSTNAKAKDYLSRREALRLGSGLGIGAIAAASSAKISNASDDTSTSQPVVQARPKGKVKNIIFMVSDGMSMGVPTLADPFSKLIRGEGTVWPRLLNDSAAYHGYLETRSANSLVTDSAAAASGWGSGAHVDNGSLNILPNGKEKTPLARILQDQGMRVGLVTTDKITGATPAGFAIAEKSRQEYFSIAEKYLGVVHILLGGGRQYFDPEFRNDEQDLFSKYETNGYQLCKNRKEIHRLSHSDRMLGLFAADMLPFTIDQLSDPGLNLETPMLSEMTQLAIDNMVEHDKEFFLMIEGGRVDHAAHKNDAAALLYEQIAFEDAIGIALKFVQKRDDTLLVVTSDHGNANPGLNGFGPGYTKTDESFARLSKINASFGSIRDQLRDASTKMELPDAAEEVLDKTCGFPIPPKTAKLVGEALVMRRLPNELAILQKSWVGVLSQVLGNYTGIGFTGTNHTADRTMLTAIGPGAERFAGIRPHTEVFRHIVELLGVTVS